MVVFKFALILRSISALMTFYGGYSNCAHFALTLRSFCALLQYVALCCVHFALILRQELKWNTFCAPYIISSVALSCALNEKHDKSAK